MNRIKDRAGTLYAVLLGMAVLATSSIASAETTKWRMHAAAPDARNEIKDTQWFADRVGELTNGEFTIELFPGGALGIKDADMLRTLPAANVVQAALLYPGWLSRDAPEYSTTLPPGVVSKVGAVEEMLPDLRSIYSRTYDKSGIKLVGFIGHAAAKTHIFCKEPINTLEDLKSKKVRVWEAFQIETFEKLGVPAQIVGQNDLYVGLSTGVVDCAVYPATFADTISLQEVASNAAYLFPYVLHPMNIIVSQTAFDELSDEHKSALQKAADEATARSFANYSAAAYDEAAIAELKAKGVNMMDDFPAADQAAFSAAAREVWRAKAAENGEQAEADLSTVSKYLN